VIIIAGVLLALVAAYIVLQPLLRANAGHAPEDVVALFSDSDDEDDPAAARRDRALAALKEIDFDKATGKLSDEDYAELKAQFTQEALDALEAVDSSVPSPIPHPPAANEAIESLIASARGRRFCLECGTPLEAGKKFCIECGARAGAAQS
jgi:hypothetical protein